MKNIILFGLTSLLADFSSEMIQPLMPFFITVLGYVLFAASSLGFIFANSLFSLSKPS